MPYATDLQKSAEWLIANQNRVDGGWGLGPGYPSSIVNTAEATYVLRRAGQLFRSYCIAGENFICKNLFSHLERSGNRTRYVSFSMLALGESARNDLIDFLVSCRDWLLAARNPDAGWGHEKCDAASSLWPTFLAIWALQLSGCSSEELDLSYRWVLSAASTRGWGLNLRTEATPVATAYGVLSLLDSPYRDHDDVMQGKELLLQTTQWGIVDENIPGALWSHCTYPWVLRALAFTQKDIFSTVLANGIKYVNRLRRTDGGWAESPENNALSVRSQFWAVLCLDALKEAFDPENHIPNIDAERTSTSLTGPDFMRIWVHSSWATILPSKLYRVIVYAMLAVSLVLLLGLHRVYSLPQRADSGLALGLLAASAFLIRKRRRHFSKLYRFAAGIIGLLAFLNLTIGTTVYQILSFVSSFFQRHLHWS